MRFSSYSHTSSSSSASTDGSLWNSSNTSAGRSTPTGAGLQSSNNQSVSFLSCILRRLLCGNVSRRSSSHGRVSGDEIIPCQDRMVEEKIRNSSPSIVARLMGLESMPEFGSVRNQDSISRSQSVNSLNNWPKSDPTQDIHSRVRMSLSFREIPRSFHQEEKEFIHLCFGCDDKEQVILPGTKEVKCGVHFGEINAKEKRKERIREKTDEENDRGISHQKIMPERRIERRPSWKASNSFESRNTIPLQRIDVCTKPCSVPRDENSPKPTNYKRLADIVNFTRGSMGFSGKSVGSECGYGSSSPVSVLDQPFYKDRTFLTDSETPSDDPTMVPLNFRRKLLSIHESSSYSFLFDKDIRSRKDVFGKRFPGYSSLDCSEMWRGICQMTEDDVKQSNWVLMFESQMEDVEEIGIEFVEPILYFLLDEALVELVGNH